MQRHIRPRLSFSSLIALAILALAGCGSDAVTSVAESLTTKSETPASKTPDVGDKSSTPASPASKTPNVGDKSSARPPASEPTGRLTLDGQSWDLTFDTTDPNSSCEIFPGSMANVWGMKTPTGNTVGVTYLTTMLSKSTATYHDKNPAQSRMISGETSSEEPVWSLDGSTIRVSGLWFLADTSQSEVMGELEITC